MGYSVQQSQARGWVSLTFLLLIDDLHTDCLIHK